MMEKLPFHSHEGLRGDVSPAVPTASTTSQRDRAFRHILAAIISLSLAFFLISAKVLDDGSTVSAAIDHPHGASANRVPFEAHVMSKCPDARDCLQQLVIPAMEQISDKVDFELSFIANVSNSTSDVECMHGPGECIGDMLILCAANLPFPSDGSNTYPRTPVIRSLGYANCLIGDYPDIPDRKLVEQCALEHGIEFDALNKCASEQNDEIRGGDEKSPLSGLGLLRESASHSAELGISTSCTVRLDESVWCVRDGGAWKDCAKDGKGSDVSVLVDEIKRLYGERN
ncbi:hypothetical protein MW887_011074 [Aspergillus wentii]|nr:hypothetical protein MW887_011074 [Aspergillus wentii]